MKDLGYVKYKENSYKKYYDEEYSKIIAFTESKTWNISCIWDDFSIGEHLAIHEKMKELGWI